MDLPEWEFVPSRFERLKILPFTWEEFVAVWDRYLEVFFKAETFSEYMLLVGDVFFYASQSLMLLMPLFLLLKTVIDKYLNERNNEYDEESKALQRVKRIADKTYIPVKRWLKKYMEFLKENDKWQSIWIFMWLLYFNIIAIIVEFLSLSLK